MRLVEDLLYLWEYGNVWNLGQPFCMRYQYKHTSLTKSKGNMLKGVKNVMFQVV